MKKTDKSTFSTLKGELFIKMAYAQKRGNWELLRNVAEESLKHYPNWKDAMEWLHEAEQNLDTHIP